MKMTCQACGATNSAETMTSDEACRKTLAVCCRMPGPLPMVILNYLSLFRPEKSSLTWGKALRLAQELEQLVGKGHVQIERKPARPCQPRIWAMAIEEMLERRSRLTRPLKNHNYLRDVAYTIADREDAAIEKKTLAAERDGNLVIRPGGEPETLAGVSPELLARLPESVKKKYGV
ncbi:MAG: hypothetical protein ACOY32_15225 [Thermodesulfobacteriota bacterium]